MQTLTEYDIQAEDFLKETDSTLEIEFLEFEKPWKESKLETFRYNVTLKRGKRSYKVVYSGSINDVEKYLRRLYLAPHLNYGPKCLWDEDIYKQFKVNIKRPTFKTSKIPLPSAYEILACLTKNDVGTFDNFIGDFGYPTNTEEEIKEAKRVYKAVKKEYQGLTSLYSDEELERMAEIQ